MDLLNDIYTDLRTRNLIPRDVTRPHEILIYQIMVEIHARAPDELNSRTISITQEPRRIDPYPIDIIFDIDTHLEFISMIPNIYAFQFLYYIYTFLLHFKENESGRDRFEYYVYKFLDKINGTKIISVHNFIQTIDKYMNLPDTKFKHVEGDGRVFKTHIYKNARTLREYIYRFQLCRRQGISISPIPTIDGQERRFFDPAQSLTINKHRDNPNIYSKVNIFGEYTDFFYFQSAAVLGESKMVVCAEHSIYLKILHILADCDKTNFPVNRIYEIEPLLKSLSSTFSSQCNLFSIYFENTPISSNSITLF